MGRRFSRVRAISKWRKLKFSKLRNKPTVPPNRARVLFPDCFWNWFVAPLLPSHLITSLSISRGSLNRCWWTRPLTRPNTQSKRPSSSIILVCASETRSLKPIFYFSNNQCQWKLVNAPLIVQILTNECDKVLLSQLMNWISVIGSENTAHKNERGAIMIQYSEENNRLMQKPTH
jgi:hypothetical protein